MHLTVTPDPGPWWAEGSFLAWAAITISLVAAGFTGWQAIMAFRARAGDNERNLVEWEGGEWADRDLLVVRSKGPDVARHVWARLTMSGVMHEVKLKRLRQSDALRFHVPELSKFWDPFNAREPLPGETWNWTGICTYGLVITWRTKYGKAQEQRIEGSIQRKVRFEPNALGDDSPVFVV